MQKKVFDFTDPKKWKSLEEKWRKKYVLTELAGGQVLECDEEAFDRIGDEFKFNYGKWRLALLKKSLKEPQLNEKQLTEMPASLLTFLLDQATRMNTIGAEERAFLLKLQRSATEADTT